jgi:hypothetical protein
MGIAGMIRMSYMISNADGSAGSDKLSLYNASVMMVLVQLYYYAAMRIQRYGDMTIEAYHGRVMKWYKRSQKPAVPKTSQKPAVPNFSRNNPFSGRFQIFQTSQKPAVPQYPHCSAIALAIP